MQVNKKHIKLNMTARYIILICFLLPHLMIHIQKMGIIITKTPPNTQFNSMFSLFHFLIIFTHKLNLSSNIYAKLYY